MVSAAEARRPSTRSIRRCCSRVIGFDRSTCQLATRPPRKSGARVGATDAFPDQAFADRARSSTDRTGVGGKAGRAEERRREAHAATSNESCSGEPQRPAPVVVDGSPEESNESDGFSSGRVGGRGSSLSFGEQSRGGPWRLP